MAQSSVPLIAAMIIVAIGTAANTRRVQAQPAETGVEHIPASHARVTLKPMTTTITTYVQARRGPAITVRAGRAGVLSDLMVTPGRHVSAGQVVGHLGGPAITSALKQEQSALQAAQVALKTEQASLTLAQQRATAHFGSNQEVYQATLARDDAQARVVDSSTRLKLLKSQQTLRSPGDGVVSATPSVTGDAVKDGDAVVVLQPDKALWLEGQVFGSAVSQLDEGQTGVFTPSDGSPPTKVKVTGLLPTQQGLNVRFRRSEADATGAAALYAGNTGRVDIQLARSPQPAVPSEALILDQGRWWVMLEDGNGVHAQAVDPIASNDGWTWLRGKVHAGDHIRVSDAYLSFHQSFSTRYQQPD